ncbi:MAG TPA: transposase family protein [Trichormus sp. M33_DOE_039]|nr:transposase family protein [Trichormus sp. M33_DOE_039]
MTTSLITELKKVPDFRTQQGQRYPLWLVLLFVSRGYRSLGDFVKRHKNCLAEVLSIPLSRVPSYSTIRRVMMRVNFEVLTQIFNNWANQYVQLDESEWLAIDGKSIKSTVTDYSQAYQSFISLVSLFSSKKGLTVGLQPMNNKQ